MAKHSFCYLLFLLTFLSSIGKVHTQVSINNSLTPPDPSAMLDVSSTNQGMLIPRMTQLERNNITNPSHSLMVYQTDGESGYYYNSGTPISPVWIPLSSSDSETSSRIPIDTLPYSITVSGSYYLTASLNAGSSSDGITINTSNVTIDLNGYGLIGTGSGSGASIKSIGAISQLSIFNGFISNWGGYGINLTSASSASLAHLKVSDCGFSGFILGEESLVNSCIATSNGLDGINANNSSTILNCLALDNGSDGIDVSSYCTVFNSHSKSNQGNGIETSSSCQVKNCLAYSNDDNGIYLGSGSTVAGSIASGNTLSGFELLTGSKCDNNQARSNSGNGYLIGNDAVVTNCAADNNSLSGFLCDSSDARIDNNQSTDNGQHGFSITGSGTIIIRNTSSGNVSLPYNISGGNASGTVLTSATLNSNSNPFANIQF